MPPYRIPKLNKKKDSPPKKSEGTEKAKKRNKSAGKPPTTSAEHPSPQPYFYHIRPRDKVDGLSVKAQEIYHKIYRVPESALRNIKRMSQIGILIFEIIHANHPTYYNNMAETMNDTIDALTLCFAYNRGNCKVSSALHLQTKARDAELNQAIAHICEFCYVGRWTAGIHKATMCDLKAILEGNSIYQAITNTNLEQRVSSRLSISSLNIPSMTSQTRNPQIQSHESSVKRAGVPETAVNALSLPADMQDLTLQGSSIGMESDPVFGAPLSDKEEPAVIDGNQ